jgi:4-amino-4-deoxy-L-arabinose transferase-like glycosyltransferase
VKEERRDTWWLLGLALSLRLAVAAFGASRFPPADDGSFYHQVALRISQGLGYTWAWPDGAVTYAAHYPVGYPGLLGAAYAVLGARPLTAMLVNAVVGSLLVVAVHRIALGYAGRRRARLAALLLALHPTLVLYTGALMTEALAAALLVLLAAGALWLRALRQQGRAWWWRLGLGVGGAGLVLVRPQLLPMLPVLGAIAVSVPDAERWPLALALRLRGAAEVTLVALALCVPWTLRNCEKMDGCVFVSANGGWNLLIGTLPEGKGSFAPIAGPSVPPECREVFGEAGKDRCFGRAGAQRIAEDPLGWLALAPSKLGQLFDHGAVASSYLHASNSALVSERIKLGLAVVETLCSRLLLLGACLGLLRAAVCRYGRGFALVSAALTLSPWGWLAELGLLAGLLTLRPTPGRQPHVLLAVAVLGLLLVTHVVFFGAARYALVWLPWLPLLLVLRRRAESRGGAPTTNEIANKSKDLTGQARADDNFRS